MHGNLVTLQAIAGVQVRGLRANGTGYRIRKGKKEYIPCISVWFRGYVHADVTITTQAWAGQAIRACSLELAR